MLVECANIVVRYRQYLISLKCTQKLLGVFNSLRPGAEAGRFKSENADYFRTIIVCNIDPETVSTPGAAPGMERPN